MGFPTLRSERRFLEGELRAAVLRIEALGRELDALRNLTPGSGNPAPTRSIAVQSVYVEAELTRQQIAAELLRSRIHATDGPTRPASPGERGDDTQ